MVNFKDFSRPLSVIQGNFIFKDFSRQLVLYIQVLFKPVLTLHSSATKGSIFGLGHHLPLYFVCESRD